jgi:Fur family transcriptional regulator, ferric uptake regulator
MGRERPVYARLPAPGPHRDRPRSAHPGPCRRRCRSCNSLQVLDSAAVDQADRDARETLQALRERGLRMTPQRQAIVTEIMRAPGHISPAAVARRIQERMPGVNPSTVYRTLSLLEELGYLSHAHMETGAEYHRAGEGGHVHLTCSNCGAEDDLSLAEAESLERLVRKHRGFRPDLTHFAISGLCASCQ